MENIFSFDDWGRIYESEEPFYVIEKGDNLEKIAKKLGIENWKDLYDLNKDVIGKNPNSIRVGMKLKVPGQIPSDEIPPDFTEKKYFKIMSDTNLLSSISKASPASSTEVYKLSPNIKPKFAQEPKSSVGKVFSKLAKNISTKLKNLDPSPYSKDSKKSPSGSENLYQLNSNKYSQFGNDSIQNSIGLKDLSVGSYSWKEGSSGMPIDIYFKSKTPVFKKPGDGTTYCTGYTFAVAFITCLNRGLLKDFTDSDIKEMQKVWNLGNAKDYPKLCVDAISKPLSSILKPLGREVSLNSVKPGDFCQLWRTNGSGHSVVIVDAIKSRGKVTGIKYYSSNQSVNPETKKSGPGEKIEYFSDSGGSVLRDKTYFARLNK